MMKKNINALRWGFSVGLALVLGAVSPSSESFAAQGFVPIQAPKRILRALPLFRLDTRVLKAAIDDRPLAQPQQTPAMSMRPDFAASLNDLKPGTLLNESRIRSGGAWPGVTATGWYPPDPDIAVGPNHLLEVVNSSVAWFTRAGAKQVQQTMATFFSGLATSSFLFDPKAFYDKHNGRFVVLCLERDTTAQTSHVLVAVSDDNDPNGVWFRYRIEVTLTINGQRYWLDYPGFGYSDGAYVVSGNMFGFSNGFGGVQFVTLPAAQLINGQPADAVLMTDSSGASVQMAEVQDAGVTTAYGISRSSSSAVRVYAIKAPGTVSAALYSANVTTPSNSSPTTDAQSTGGYLLDTIDGRVFNAVWRGGSLVTAHSSTPSTGAPVAVRWYEVKTGAWPDAGASSPSLAQAGLISSSTLNYFTPAINKNAAGDIAVLFSASSSTLTADIKVAGRKAGDLAGYMGEPITVRSSDGTSYSQGRWGDYFGVDVDPNDDANFVGVGEYVGSGNGWATEVVQWQVATTNVPPDTPAALTVGSVTATSINLTWPDSTGETSYELQRSMDGTNFALIAAPASNVTNYSDTGLAPATRYYYRIRAVNSAGVSQYSPVATATTGSLPVPNPPTGLTAGSPTKTSITLSWTDASDNEQGFKLERTTGSTWTLVATLAANTRTYRNTGLKPLTTYSYRVRAYNAAGDSPNSNTATATTTAR